MTNRGGRTDTPIACDLFAIPADRRASHVALVRSLFGGEHTLIQSSDVLELTLPADKLGDVVSFIENERRCCRHLAFHVDVPASYAPLTLRLAGPGAIDALEALIR